MRQTIFMTLLLLFVLSSVGMAIPSVQFPATAIAFISVCALALVTQTTTPQHWIVVTNVACYMAILFQHGAMEKTQVAKMGDRWESFNKTIALLLLAYSLCYGYIYLRPEPPMFVCVLSLLLAIIISVFVMMQFLQATYFVTNG
jgi:hypothetical protein